MTESPRPLAAPSHGDEDDGEEGMSYPGEGDKLLPLVGACWLGAM
jgi:hypothetical protein